MSVILDPKWTPQRLARVGRDISFAWLALNRLPLPDRLFLNRESAGDMLERAWLGSHQTKNGFSRIAVAVEDCDFSGRFDTPQGMLIQAPGSFEDHTALGVLCHEVGHHVDFSLNPRAYSRSKASGFSVMLDDEEEVSRGEYNVHESFAEAIRLFMTNPDLLRRGRPNRWEHLTRKLKLKPLHNQRWQTVLRKAPRYIHRSVEGWLKEE